MFIDIYKIGPEGRSFDEPVLEEVAREHEGDSTRVLAARLSGTAAPGERGVDLRARLEARVALECSRCLEPFESAISTDFYLNLVPDGVEFGVGETEVSEESAALFYAPEGKADLGVIATEQLNLNLPLKPVCQEGCRGLCATCGANRNRIECGCRSEEIDPRLAPLLKFKKPTNDA
jgi:uncharacterized protein